MVKRMHEDKWAAPCLEVKRHDWALLFEMPVEVETGLAIVKQEKILSAHGYLSKSGLYWTVIVEEKVKLFSKDTAKGGRCSIF